MRSLKNVPKPTFSAGWERRVGGVQGEAPHPPMLEQKTKQNQGGVGGGGGGDIRISYFLHISNLAAEKRDSFHHWPESTVK